MRIQNIVNEVRQRICHHTGEDIGMDGLQVCSKCGARMVINKEKAMAFLNKWVDIMEFNTIQAKSSASESSAGSYLMALYQWRKVASNV